MGSAEAGPAAFIDTAETAAEDFEHQLEVGRVPGTIDYSKGAETEGRGDLAGFLTAGAGGFHDDDRRGLTEAGQELEEAGSAFFRGLGAGLVVEGEAEIDHGDVDGGLGDDLGGLAAAAGPEGADAEGLEEEGEAVGPGFGGPAGVGEEEVEAVGGAGVRGRGGGLGGSGMWARSVHLRGSRAMAVPGLRGGLRGGDWGIGRW